MTEAAASALRSEPNSEPNPYIQAWVDSLAQVLGQITGSPQPWVALAEAPAELASSGVGDPGGDDVRGDDVKVDNLKIGDLWVVGACSGGLRGEMSLRLPAASVLRLARIFMSEPPAPAAEVTSEINAEHREAAVELLRQVAGLVSSALKARWGEVQLRLDPASGAPSWPASFTSWLRLAENSPAPGALIEMQLSAALAAALRAEKPETAAAVPAAPVASNPDASSANASSPAGNQGKIDLLMDVELAVTLRFGGRSMLLREVLDLHPGAVVDLDRQIKDPVDLLLDGRLVARGEVVVLDGNYGVRVTEVVSASL
jgi:flagellar motor switch protein FliN/FliY